MPDLFTETAQRELGQRLARCLSGELAEEFLKTLLTLMSIVFVVNRDYRRNIKGFTGRYQFLSKDGQLTMAAVFREGRMEVVERRIADPHITVTFRDGQTLINFLLTPRQDILGAMLRHDVQTRGNLNYLNKFAYMANSCSACCPGRDSWADRRHRPLRPARRPGHPHHGVLQGLPAALPLVPQPGVHRSPGGVGPAG